MVLALPRLLVLSKNQLNSWYPIIQWNDWVKQYSCYPFFFFEKEMTDRVPVKGNSIDSGPLFRARNFIVIRLPFAKRMKSCKRGATGGPEDSPPLLTKVIFVNRLKPKRKKIGGMEGDVTNHIEFQPEFVKTGYTVICKSIEPPNKKQL